MAVFGDPLLVCQNHGLGYVCPCNTFLFLLFFIPLEFFHFLILLLFPQLCDPGVAYTRRGTVGCFADQNSNNDHMAPKTLTLFVLTRMCLAHSVTVAGAVVRVSRPLFKG